MGSGRLLDHRVLLGIPVPSSQQRGSSDSSAKLIAASKDEYFECTQQDISENKKQVLSIWHGISTEFKCEPKLNGWA